MVGTIIFAVTLLLIHVEADGDDVITYEFGNHVDGEKLVYKYGEAIPNVLPMFRLNMTHNNSNFEKDYSYVNFNIPSSMKDKVEVGYDPFIKVLTIKPLETSLFKNNKVALNLFAYSVPLSRRQEIEKERRIRKEIEKYKMYLISI